MPANDPYAEIVLADQPVGYWRLNERSHDNQVTDESRNGHHGKFVGYPTLGVPGAIRGSSNCSMSFAPPVHIEIPNSADFSIQTSGHGLSVEAWIRLDRLLFEGESRKKYIHWLGKGDYQKMEWGFRLYSSDHPDRPRQISAYAWNPQGYLGAGSYYKGNSVQEGEWLHVVACYDH